MSRYFAIFCVLLGMSSCQKENPSQPGLLVPKTVTDDHSVPSLKINGTLLHVETYGQPDRPVVLVIHGGPGGDFRSLLKAKVLADSGFFVVFYDQRGTGLSERVDRSQFSSDGAIRSMVDDLDALATHFKTFASQKVFLLGHSWGAMLATAYINEFPDKINGAVLAEPGGFTWPQTESYLSRSNKIKIFSEALNDAVFPEQIFSGRDEHEILDYKASFFGSFENAPGNTIGNEGPYPFWRNGAVAFSALIENAESHGFDFTTHLQQFKPKVLMLYSQFNQAYGESWAKTVIAPYPNSELAQIKNAGHEMLYFGWDNSLPFILKYLNELK